MPVEKVYKSSDCIWGFWKVVEDQVSLSAILPNEKIPLLINNSLKRLEFLAGRVLIQSLLKAWNVEYMGLTKDAFGKPFLVNCDFRISLSHSYPYVAAIIHRNKNVGIDLEQPKNKLLKIAPRILAEGELKDAGNDIIKHCIYWCAKETLIKIYGKKDLILSRDLLISPFFLQRDGYLVGRILADKTETDIPLHYLVYENFVVVVSN